MHISRSPYARSSVSNGKRSHRTRAQGGIDGRSREARRWRDTYGALVEQLGREPTPADDALLRSACDLVLASERLSEAVAAGRADSAEDLDRLHRINGSLRRTLAALGLADSKGGGERAKTLEELRREDLEAGLL